MVCSPLKLLGEAMQRLGDGGEILYEAAVVACKSQELLNLLLRLRYWPVCYFVRLRRICAYTIG